MPSELAERVAARLSGSGPFLIGVAGAVAVGKSTIASALAHELEGLGRTTGVLTTDAFLLPNVILAERELTYRKGFPETYDAQLLGDTLRAIKASTWPVAVPVYSHEIYDIVPGESIVLEAADAVIVDGVVALQKPAVDHLDVGVYVGAEEAHVRGWFVQRFLKLVEAARSDETSFYRAFIAMGADEIRGLAEATWDGINGVNLHEHIAPSKQRADLVVFMAEDHSVERIEG